ncbi:uncharacterized protein N7515_000655 [Penicillium bovifimosum]|uniref:Uncharacterized protein n=1 Tax=Penicillium bovifimosum TaxID=126998 RepID=A0A9W9HFC7_9EURO|nr:uncharacterized protein N7515_000655 [Penicillium bovifimosum]KAJ5146091.1 hypothetical protein N7515_000655 [Penicillium bovifimosum]
MDLTDPLSASITDLPSLKAVLFDHERRVFIHHCDEVALSVASKTNLTDAQLASSIRELQTHLAALCVAGNELLHDTKPGNLPQIPAGFMSDELPRPGRSPMTEFAWGCFYTKRELAWLQYQYQQSNEIFGLADGIKRCGQRWDFAENFPLFAPLVIYPTESDDWHGGRLIQLPHFQPSLQPR